MALLADVVGEDYVVLDVATGEGRREVPCEALLEGGVVCDYYCFVFGGVDAVGLLC